MPKLPEMETYRKLLMEKVGDCTITHTVVNYDEKCKVYDRGDEPCVHCQQPIIKEELSSRKVFYCKNCQH